MMSIEMPSSISTTTSMGTGVTAAVMGGDVVGIAGIASKPQQQISKELRAKANDFLNTRRHANNLVDIITHMKQSTEQKQPVTAVILTLEVIFKELLKRREMCIQITPLKPKDDGPENTYRAWLAGRYAEAWDLLIANIANERGYEAAQALISSMKLLSAECKYPLDLTEANQFPKQMLRRILVALLSLNKVQTAPLQSFQEFAQYWDILAHCWKLLPHLGSRTNFANEIFATNYLALINVLAVTKEVQEEQKFYCEMPDQCQKNATVVAAAGTDNSTSNGINGFNYNSVRKSINKVWHCIMNWSSGLKEPVHRQLLMVLIERILPHLEKPVLLTDFLMDSMDCGGVVSLLALQGIFTLIQKHNIIYPNIYEKLYSMFEPEIFHTKFKARLFYLADIFLSSTHLPENLVAAFVKRLARLSLIAPPQDAVIILYFTGNLILRHPGLKRLISASSVVEVSRDPFIMEEREPTKSNALESSLWEIVSLQKHALPSVATAAKFISQPLPTAEFDLSSVLEIKEDDIFDLEMSKKSKQYALAFERPQSLYLSKNDRVINYWELF